MVKTKKLDPINQPILVFGGPYGNLQALEALQYEANKLAIEPERIFCTGDSVAYFSQPSECVELLRDWGVHMLQGNCEQAIANNAEHCGCGFEKETQCAVDSEKWYAYAKTQITPEQAAWMGDLPERIEFCLNGLKVMMFHATFEQNNRFLFASHSDCFFVKEFEKTKTEMIIAGHCGIPFTKQVVDQGCNYIWHNAGVIGMPANNAKPTTWYSIIRPMRRLGRVDVMHKVLHYDYKLAAKQARKASYCDSYADSLTTGLWPSTDILPEEERRATGYRIKLYR